MPVTLKDIAERLDISPTTVSFAIRGKKPGKRSLSPETIAKVQKVANEMGYKPNVSARSLRKGESLSVGLIVWSQERLNEPLFPEFLKGIGLACNNLGYGLEINMVYAENYGEKLVDIEKGYFSEKRVDGYLLLFVDELNSRLLH